MWGICACSEQGIASYSDQSAATHPTQDRPSRLQARAAVLHRSVVSASRSLVGDERLDQAAVHQDGDEQVCQGLVVLGGLFVQLGDFAPLGRVHCCTNLRSLSTASRQARARSNGAVGSMVPTGPMGDQLAILQTTIVVSSASGSPWVNSCRS